MSLRARALEYDGRAEKLMDEREGPSNDAA
jgi:hypothetical protein